MSDAVIGALVALLVGAAVLGQIDRRVRNLPLKEAYPYLPLGDRVAAGMIAACLLLGVWKGNTPDVNAWLPIATAAPLVFYSIVLASRDWESLFTRWILVGMVIIFLSLVAIILIGAPDSASA